MKRLLFLVVLLAACSREPSVASKSAAAYDEAKAKGVQVGGGHEHGGHGAAPSPAAATDHSAHAGMDHSAHGGAPAADHAAMGHAATEHAAMGHAEAAHAATGHSATGHAATGHATTGHSATGHSATPQTAHTQHTGHTPPSAPSVPPPPRSSTDTQRLDPATTLAPDAFDAPAPASVAEAAKAQGGGHAGHGEPSSTNTATIYTCPMHPEVTSDKPGTCPKCGMALVEKK